MKHTQANAIYDILVRYGGANESDRNSFVFHHCDADDLCHEWRFCGHFGFGGKFYSDSKWFVSYHKNDVSSNPKLYQSLCDAINQLLEYFVEQNHENQE